MDMLQTLINVDEHVFGTIHSWLPVAPGLWRVVAVYGVYLVPLILVWFWFARRRETALLAFISGFIAWVGLNNVISHFIHRLRPADLYNFVLPSQEGLFHRPGSSFPSDHTAFFAALIGIFWLAGERGVATLIAIIGFATLLGRIVLGLHWPGDILVGIIVGLITAVLIWAIRRPIERSLIQPAVVLARRLHL